MRKNTDLDNLDIYEQLDHDGMLTCIHDMPKMCQQAWHLAVNFDLPPDYSHVNKVLILGMGGSAIGGDLVNSLAASQSKVVILVHRDYGLPSFVDSKTLVIASSYSGMTEETLDSFNRALHTASKKLAITTGGKLKDLAEKREIPVFDFDYEAQPRATLPYSLFPIIAFLQKLGIINDKSEDVLQTIQVLKEISSRINESVLLPQNIAKQLARKLYNHLPVIYGGGILSEVAHRWKTQLNENSKAWAFHEVFPELNHNAVVGYQFPSELSSKIFVVLLRSPLLPQRIKIRYQVACQLLDQANVDYQIVDGEGANPLSQIMSLVLFGDYVSYYLAILYKIDPTPVEAIDYLKEQLSRPTYFA